MQRFQADRFVDVNDRLATPDSALDQNFLGLETEVQLPIPAVESLHGDAASHSHAEDKLGNFEVQDLMSRFNRHFDGSGTAIAFPIRIDADPYAHGHHSIATVAAQSAASDVPYYIAALISASEAKWPGPDDGPTVVTYSFLTEKPDGAGVDNLSGFAWFSNSARQTVAEAFGLFENVANIQFDLVESGGDIRLGYIDLPPGVGGRSSGVGAPSYLWMNKEAGAPPPPLEAGSSAFTTLLHEIGHAIGLKHPHGGGVGLPEYQDNDQFTLMSYSGHLTMGGTPRTPQLFDVAAVQYLYGANTAHNDGTNIYTWATNEWFIETIWDAGGMDTFNAALQTREVFIDLNPGGFSSIGANGLDSATDNVAIAFNTIIENAIGGAGDDTLHGNAENNILIGMDGDDLLRGMAGDDDLYGRAGNDTLIGSDGNDELFGEDGDDILNGSDGDDQLHGGAGLDTLNGGKGNDHLNGGNGGDELRGGAGADLLEGRFGNDELYGDDGDDLLEGWDGADLLNGGNGNDLMRGQAGSDSLYGGMGNDEAYGGNGNDLVDGEAGADRLFGGNGNDLMQGGAGADIVRGGNGDDLMYGGRHRDLMFGEAGDDELWGDNGNDLLVGGSGADLLRGNQGNDSLHGGNGNDELRGGMGNDTLNGVSNNQVLYGTPPSQYDTLTGGSGADRFVLYAAYLTNPYYLGLGFATLTDFDRTEGDRIVISDNSGYSLGTGNWGGSSQDDTGIYYNGDLIGVVQDTTQVHLFLDFDRVADAIV